MPNNYYGKYRAKVADINDPEKRGRIKVTCPSVLGEGRSNWCEPCIPVAYDNGGDFCPPKIGETTWIEFEAGDPNKPIYVGNWWSKDKTPSVEYELNKRIIEFDGCVVTMKKGEMTLKVGESSIVLKDSSIKLVSPRIDWN